MNKEDFGFLIEQLNQVVRETVITVGLVNQSTANLFAELPQAQTPIGVNGFSLMVYEGLSDDHVLFFSSTSDAQEFIDACEECIKETDSADPKAMVGAVVALQRQRLIKRNSIIDKEIINVGPRTQ